MAHEFARSCMTPSRKASSCCGRRHVLLGRAAPSCLGLTRYSFGPAPERRVARPGPRASSSSAICTALVAAPLAQVVGDDPEVKRLLVAGIATDAPD